MWIGWVGFGFAGWVTSLTTDLTKGKNQVFILIPGSQLLHVHLGKLPTHPVLFYKAVGFGGRVTSTGALGALIFHPVLVRYHRAIIGGFSCR